MDIKNFFNKIMSGSKMPNVPQSVLDAFDQQFSDALNTEWLKTGEYFEAVFYKDELENIARFLSNGKVVSRKVNTPLNGVPKPIKDAAKPYGELMNAIVIHHQEAVSYQLIVRDKKLIRYFLLLDSKGEIIEKEKLQFFP